jgi:hypothetical protein
MVRERTYRISRQTRFNPLMWKENMSAGIDLLPRASASIWGIGGAWTKLRERDVDDGRLRSAAWRGARDTLDGPDPTMEHPMMQVTWPSRSAVPVAQGGRHRTFRRHVIPPRLPSASALL